MFLGAFGAEAASTTLVWRRWRRIGLRRCTVDGWESAAASGAEVQLGVA